MTSLPLSPHALEHASIEHVATRVRDQPLTCKSCSNLFHKKCTDRSGARGGAWNREPWFCFSCRSRGTIPPNETASISTATLSHNTSSHLSSSIFPVSLHPPPDTSIHYEDNSIIEINETPPEDTRGRDGHEQHGEAPTRQLAVHEHLDPSAEDFIPRTLPSLRQTVNSPTQADIPPGQLPAGLLNQPEAVPLPQTILAPTYQQQKFPNNSIRQRKSNIATLDPEIEFQKATIDACRSTIAQQEAELKRLNECLDLRNKKVMQLESQVGIARSYISG